MRKLSKLEEPEVLRLNRMVWQQQFEEDEGNSTRKYRYREKSIKEQAKRETSSKCAYCESKIGHNTPGDIEHKIPTSVDKTRHFDWTNLTIACTECNRRKNDYFSETRPFLDPYDDDVDELVIHYGPVVSWTVGNDCAEISVKTLELHNWNRVDLMLRKIDLLNELDERLERYARETNAVLKEILWREIRQMEEVSAEYSAMIRSVLAPHHATRTTNVPSTGQEGDD